METIRIESQITLDDLLNVVGRLSLTDLEKFVPQVLRLQAQRKAASLPDEQAELLLKINQGFPTALDKSYKILQMKCQAETLTTEEQQTWADLINQREKWQAQRLEALAELANLRNMTLREVMQQLGIKSLSYV